MLPSQATQGWRAGPPRSDPPMTQFQPFPPGIIPPECYEVLQHLWDYLDDQLTDENTEALRSHVANCPQCQKYQLFQENFLAALANLRARQSAPADVKSRVIRSLREAGFALS